MRRSEHKATPGSLGDYLVTLRTKRGMSQVLAANTAGVSRSYLCDIERGRGTKPSVDTLRRLAETYGVAADELVMRLYGEPKRQTKNAAMAELAAMRATIAGLLETVGRLEAMLSWSLATKPRELPEPDDLWRWLDDGGVAA